MVRNKKDRINSYDLLTTKRNIYNIKEETLFSKMKLKEEEIPLNTIFNPNEKFTFLCGAGISMDAPTNLPSAREFGSCLIHLCAPDEEIDNLLNLNTLRYEMIVEEVKIAFDKDLKFLDYFDLDMSPNIIHDFIATAIINGNNAITTNFDYMIESALKKILESQNHSDIVPIITKHDYITFQDPNILIHEKKYPVYKIHGSKKNIITGKDTKESLITTMSALGKNREEGETFAIESFKKPATQNLLKDRTLVVMGYSGSDSFDIGPMLKEMLHCKKLVWIDHANCSAYHTYRLLPNSPQILDKNSSKIDKLLEEIARRDIFPIFKIEATTKDFIKNVLFPHFFNTMNLPSSYLTSHTDLPSFSRWIRTIKLYSHISEERKFFFAARLNSKLDQLNSSERCYNSMWELIKNGNNEKLKMRYFGNIGVIYRKRGDYKKALEHFEKALKISNQLNNLQAKSSQLTRIGEIYFRQCDYLKATEIIHQAIQINNQLGDLGGKSGNLNLFGEIYRAHSKYAKALECHREGLQIATQLGDLGGN